MIQDIQAKLKDIENENNTAKISQRLSYLAIIFHVLH